MIRLLICLPISALQQAPNSKMVMDFFVFNFVKDFFLFISFQGVSMDGIEGAINLNPSFLGHRFGEILLTGQTHVPVFFHYRNVIFSILDRLCGRPNIHES